LKKSYYLLIACLLLLFAIPASAQDIPTFSELPLGEWSQIDVPDGICLYGADYSFYVRPNEEPTDNLLIYFQGGGACWDGFTCGSIGQFASFFDVSPTLMNFYRQGIFDFENDNNPLLDYNMVFLPYCTGDVHSGSNEITFDVPPEANADFEQIDVFFNGYNNAQLVLDWVYDNFPQPEQIVVSGCSAGGYGAITNAPFVMEHYQGTPTALIADASAGVLTSDWQGTTTWGSLSVLPEFIPALANVDPDSYDTTYHIEQSAIYFPENEFAQYNSYIDGVQVGFYAASQGGELDFETQGVAIAAQWSATLLRNTTALSAYDNYNYYTAGGFEHCVVNNDLFYEYDQSGVVFADWFGDVIAESADNVTCSVLNGSCFVAPNEDEATD